LNLYTDLETEILYKWNVKRTLIQQVDCRFTIKKGKVVPVLN